MDTPTSAQIAVLALALAPGVAMAWSFDAQLKLQRRAIGGDAKASLFNRVTMAGLSMSLLLAAILAAKAFKDVVSYEAFMGATFFAAVITFALRLRSNSTVKTDARKDDARRLP